MLSPRHQSLRRNSSWHLSALVGYAGVILAVGAGILVVAALAFVAEMVVAAAFLAFVAVILLVAVPIAFLDTLAKNKARRDQNSHPSK
jgi:hypothetical protein